MEDFFDLIGRRQSCRSYSAVPVEREKLLRCIEAARLAPSACNSQPWSFVIVNGGETARQVAKCLQGAGMNRFTDHCPAFVVALEEHANLSERVASAIKSQTFASVDIGLACMQFCLAATEQGLGTCIMGWFSEPRLRELLDIPKGKRVRLVIGVGYPANDAVRPKARKPLEQIARFIDGE